MTGYLSRRADRLEQFFPDVCPKCGHEFRKEPVATRDVARSERVKHFTDRHPGAIGTATLRSDPFFSQPFCYLGPVYGETGNDRRLNVVWLNWPVEVVKMRRSNYIVTWSGADPTEGDQE